jgi:hypothetical protein
MYGRGSLAGGTRVIISGSGFSANTNSGNMVYLGFAPVMLQCMPIPLHSTVNQIACKTQSALPYTYERTSSLAHVTSAWYLPAYGVTKLLNVTVVSDGEVSSCIGTCVFQYHEDWVHTPRVSNIVPRAVSPGTLLAVSGV